MKFAKKYHSVLMWIAEIALLCILLLPAVKNLLQPGYFSMHDDQHVARLYQLDKGIQQGVWYPRWVGELGFNHGYALFNFYPPLIYYVALPFHWIGFSYIWSIKIMLIAGFFVSMFGTYLLAKKKFGWQAGVVAATLSTYFFYHAVLVFVRGAFAEFFAMSMLPFVFYGLTLVAECTSIRRVLFAGSMLALLILAHPLIAFPSLLFIGLFVLFLLAESKEKLHVFMHLAIVGVIGVMLSAFFWLPSMMERKFTLVDDILTTQLADYTKHFVCPSQLWYSSWGYGGSERNCLTGFTLQLGKVQILLFLASCVCLIVLHVKKKKITSSNNHLMVYGLFFLMSVFFMTSYSSGVWERVSFLWYMQFPWRFMTFATVFMSISCGGLLHVLSQLMYESKYKKMFMLVVTIGIVCVTIAKYQQYFVPQQFRDVSDTDLTSFHDVAWRISRTSYEFMPKGLELTQSTLHTSVPNIQEKDVRDLPVIIVSGDATYTMITNLFHKKIIQFTAETETTVQLQNTNFPGWSACMKQSQTSTDCAKLQIQDDNALKLITLTIPKGKYILEVEFKDTLVRVIADVLSITSAGTVLIAWLLHDKLEVKKAKHS